VAYHPEWRKHAKIFLPSLTSWNQCCNELASARHGLCSACVQHQLAATVTTPIHKNLTSCDKKWSTMIHTITFGVHMMQSSSPKNTNPCNKHLDYGRLIRILYHFPLNRPGVAALCSGSQPPRVARSGHSSFGKWWIEIGWVSRFIDQLESPPVKKRFGTWSPSSIYTSCIHHVDCWSIKRVTPKSDVSCQPKRGAKMVEMVSCCRYTYYLLVTSQFFLPFSSSFHPFFIHSCWCTQSL